MVPGNVRAHCSIVRLAKRRESLGVQSLADLTISRLLVVGPSCLTEPSTFTTKLKVVPSLSTP